MSTRRAVVALAAVLAAPVLAVYAAVQVLAWRIARAREQAR